MRKVHERGLFEFRFVIFNHNNFVGRQKKQSFVTRIRKLAGEHWNKIIFRECPVDGHFQLIDENFNEPWYQNNALWKPLIQLRFPRFSQRNIARVFCSEECAAKWEESPKGKVEVEKARRFLDQYEDGNGGANVWFQRNFSMAVLGKGLDE